MKQILLGHIAVDSACIVLADPAVLSRFDSTTLNLDELLPPGCPDLNAMTQFDAPELPFWREACWVAKSSRDRGGILGARRTADGAAFGDAVAVSTGIGDGLYPVYALITEPGEVEDPLLAGRVSMLLVDFDVPVRTPAPEVIGGLTWRESDIESLAAQLGVPLDVAMQRAREAATRIAETTATLVNEQLATAIRGDQP
jgi:hypothetical protein